MGTVSITPTLWRLHLKSDSQDDLGHSKLVAYCIGNNIAGTGWRLDDGAVAQSPEDFIEKVRIKYKGQSGFTSSISFARDVKENDLIWTRSKEGIYYLGKIGAGWKYSMSPEANERDARNQRPCHWIKIGSVEEVPGIILNCFRPTRTLQRINPHMLNSSMGLYNFWSGSKFYTDVKEGDAGKSAESFFEYIDCQDCEDVAGLFLQHKYGYFIIPSTCKQDTAGYEFVLTHTDLNKPKAYLQVKQGHVDLKNVWLGEDKTVFLFSTKGKCDPRGENTIVLEPEKLFLFAKEHKHVLPEKISRWLT